MAEATDLYLVQSPLQAMNAFELRRISDAAVRRSVLVALDQNSTRNNSMVAATLQVLDWRPDLILSYPSSAPAKILTWLRLWLFVRSLGPVQRVAVGAYDAGMMIAAANLCRGSETILLDDGTGSLIFPRYRYEGARNEYQKGDQVVPWLGFDNRLPQSITYFSIYPLLLRPPDRVERNELGFLRTSVRYDDAGPVFFVGSVFADAGMVSGEEYLAWVAKIRRRFEGKEIHYFPHRREEAEARKPAFDALGIRLVRPEVPFELHLARGGTAPCAVASFYTTVFDTLLAARLGEPQRLVAFVVPDEVLQEPMEREMAHACYRAYQAAGMRVLRDLAATGDPASP